MKNILYLYIFISLVTLGKSFAQQKQLSGQVLDEKNMPIPGATIIEVGNIRNGASTDEKGNFVIRLSNEAKSLKISAVSYLSQTINIPKSGGIFVKLKEDSRGLDEVVVVGYGRQKKLTSTGSISTIKGDEIKTVPTANIQNTLAGRLPGFFAQQRSGQPGATASDFYIRGVNSLNNDNRPLIVVDDIEYTYDQVAQLNANEIESVTILKDAATTAVFGIKGANGVLVITTKRGINGKPKIDVTYEFGINNIIRMPTFLDAYTVALLRNEAVTNDSYGQSVPANLPFSPDDLQKFKDGSDPYGHPNVNWVDELINRISTQNRFNASVSGGNSNVKYFTSLGYYTENGNLKDFTATDGQYISNNFFYRRANFRSNLDITPTKTLRIQFDINGRFQTTNSPAGYIQGNGLFYELENYNYLSPYSTALTNPNGSASSSNYNGFTNIGIGNYVNPKYRLANGGYNRAFTNDFNIRASVDQRLDNFTKGLSAAAVISYAGTVNESRNLTRAINAMPAYVYNPVTNNYTAYNNTVTRLFPYSLGGANSAFNSTIVAQLRLNYDRNFGNHHIYALAQVNQRSFENRMASPNTPVNYRGLTARLGYDYRNTYIVEFNMARNGNDIFRKENRYGTFPAVSIGYNLAEEKYFKKLLPFFDLFKLYGSYGLAGADAAYPSAVNSQIQYTTTANGYGFGQASSVGVSTTNEGAIVNPLVTWEKERKTNLALEMSLFNGKLSGKAEYFYNMRYDQYISQGDVSQIVGQSLPSKNIGKTENRGYEFTLGHKSNIGSFQYNISGNISYAKNKILYVSEAPDYPYQARTGRQLGLNLVYHAIGYYQPEDFTNGVLKPGVAKIAGYTIQPGDIRYQDTNGDGEITNADKTWFAKPNLPTTTYGLNLSFSYKNFSLAALIQGATDYVVYFQAEGAEAFGSNLRPWHLDRWTPATATTATYPRIGVYGSTGSQNNNSWNNLSDFWSTNAGYIRFKSLDVGYQLQESLVKRLGFIRSVRVYCAGYNLLTLSQMADFQQDAEISSGQGYAYPNKASYTFGIQLGI